MRGVKIVFAECPIGFPLTVLMPHRISLRMGRIIHFILVCIFLVAGVSQVPACYATKPDCNFKATASCPMIKARQTATPGKSTPCCLLDQLDEQQQSTASFPLDRLKRLKIDQIQHDVTPLPPFVLRLISSITIEQSEMHLSNTLFPHRFDNPHHRPPPLFIQYQSFLI